MLYFQSNADKDFVSNLRSSAFIGGWDFFTASKGVGRLQYVAELLKWCTLVGPSAER
jgi:hypothetical protein